MGPVPSQDDLAAVLADAGEATTQATISRDLKAIGALKGPMGYTLPSMSFRASLPATPYNGNSQGTVFSTHIHRVARADSMVVLHTAPGHAQVVAAEIDKSPPPEAVGTIAGDDTIFIATQSVQAAGQLAERILESAGLQGAAS
ncbi:MAG: transcriptional regulator of arginine metabolism [Phycisphaerales bacterium]|jgi:transcriptional regulator of arginine metabolism